MANKTVSIVLPCHNEEKNIIFLVPEIIKNIPKNYTYEIIIIDDGSTDDTKRQIYKLSKKNKKIKGIIFYKNFGHQYALLAGITKSKGKAIITMDSDFQHPPKLLPKILSLWEKGHDFIQMQKDNAKNTNIFSLRSVGYRMWEWISGGVIVPGSSDYRLISKEIVNYILDSEEREIFMRGLTKTIANNPIYVPYKVARRKYGEPTYPFKTSINLFINGFISFSTFPLRIASIVGILIAVITGFVLVFDIIRAILTGQRIVSGYLTLVFLMLILNGFIIFYMGILGEYIGVIFKEVKKRPMYLVKQTYNL